MNIVAGSLAGVGPGAGWRIGPDEAAANHLVAYGGNNTAGPIEVGTALTAHGGTGRMDFESETFVAHTLRGEGFDASEDGTGRGTPLVATTIRARDLSRDVDSDCTDTLLPFDTTQITSAANRSNPKAGDPCHPLAAGAHAPAIAFHGSQDPDVSGEKTHPVGRNQGQETCALIGARVRRLMPIECERLQGFPDGYTNISWRGKPAADGPRYKALGNSWACNVARWVGQRIDLINAIKEAA